MVRKYEMGLSKTEFFQEHTKQVSQNTFNKLTLYSLTMFLVDYGKTRIFRGLFCFVLKAESQNAG